MNNTRIPHYLSVFPTGDIPVPVCIGDLPVSSFLITPEVLTENVVSYLQSNPDIPGAIIVENKRVRSVIPRNKLFERLGYRYGVELFLKKPIHVMEAELAAEALVLKNHIPINTATKLALGRPQARIYDPLVVEYEDNSLQLLDAYVLLLSQSQLSQNLSGLVSTLNNIEIMLSNVRINPIATLELIMESLNTVVPAHHARIILHPNPELTDFEHPYLSYQIEPLKNNRIYRSVMDMNQPMVVEDVSMVPNWSNWDTPKNTRSWLGAPVVNSKGCIGLVSLSRTTFSPFTKNEKEISLVFSRYLGKLFEVALMQLKHGNHLIKKHEII